MKSKLKFIMPFFVVGMLIISACKSAKDKSEEAMDKDKTDSSIHNSTQMEYYMQFVPSPETLDAGKEITFTLTPKMKGMENEAVALETMHENKIHLILVSKDLSFYQHLHPEFNADGSYSVKTTVNYGGKYILFAEYMPSGAGDKIDRFEINVKGNELEAKIYDKENLHSNVDGYEIQFKAAGPLVTNNENHIIINISKGGKDVFTDQLENLMGAKGHLVIISADGQNLIHSHAEEGEKVIHTHATFDSPGIYRAFFQFKTDGKIHLADFVLTVNQGPENTIDHQAHEH